MGRPRSTAKEAAIPTELVIFADFPDVEGPARLERELRRLGDMRLSSFWWAPTEKWGRFPKFGHYVYSVEREQLRPFREACRRLAETGIHLQEFTAEGRHLRDPAPSLTLYVEE